MIAALRRGFLGGLACAAVAFLAVVRREHTRDLNAAEVARHIATIQETP